MSSNHSSAMSSKHLRPSSATGVRRGSAGGVLGKNSKQDRKGSPIMQKLTALFKRERNTETDEVSVRPACFANSPERKRSESPEPSGSGSRKRSTSLNNKKLWKADKEDGLSSGVGWRPKGRLEWESDSGRQITIGDVYVNELSKVEIQAMQRLAITQLQNMEIPVSHGLLRGSRNVFQRLSFNTFKQRKVNGGEKMMEGPVGPGPTGGSGSTVFGQPLTQVVSQEPVQRSGGGTPLPTTPTSLLQYHILPLPTSTSPTSITSSEASFADNSELNPTTVLLDALNISPSYSSPKSKRRMSLLPAEPQVPSIVTKAISYLDSKGVKTEGLFRIPGAKSRIIEIREKFDSGEDVELTDDVNPHDVACLLKEFFRSLPEPLMTVELFAPFLATRKLSNSAQRRDALRLLCLLLPQPNRDTLQELLEFLSRVALHSDGIILIDGTEEVGNRMTEQNLGMILGPNILHKEVKRKSQKPTDFQVQKQDPEELNNVCKVMEDLIRMHISIFTIPAQLYEACLKSLLATDSAAVDLLLKRRCYEQGLFLEEPPRGLVSRSRSSDALRKISHNRESPLSLEQELQEQEFMWQRTHSLSNTQKVLEDAIRDLDFIAEDLANLNNQRRYSSNDSAMGGSEAVVSPLQLVDGYSEPSTLNRKRQIHDSVDSAFSNYSSPTNSTSESLHHTDVLSVGSDIAVSCNHIRMSSEASNTSASAISPLPRLDSPEHTITTQQLHRIEKSPPPPPNGSALSKMEVSSLPVLSAAEQLGTQDTARKGSHTLPSQGSPPLILKGQGSRTLNSKQQPLKSASKQQPKKSKLKGQALLPSKMSNTGTYSHHRSPILNSKDQHSQSESQLDDLSSDHTPTESTNNIPSSPSGFSLDSSSNHLQGTVI